MDAKKSGDYSTTYLLTFHQASQQQQAGSCWTAAHNYFICALLGLKEESIHINMTVGIRLTIYSQDCIGMGKFRIIIRVA